MSSELAQQLSFQTKDLIARFEARASAFSKRSDLARITVPVDRARAEDFARRYLGPGDHQATGIDGSMDFDERLQMMLFYSNATAYSCPFAVGEDVRFDLDSARRESKLAASAAVPLWAEDLGDVLSDEPEIELDLEHSLQRIPNAFMTLGELYLATLACSKSKVIFLDRPMSGTYSTLLRDARLLLKRRESRLTNWSKTSSLSMLDIYLAVQIGAPTSPVPARPRYLPVAVVKALLGGASSVSELSERLGSSEQAVEKAVKRLVEVGKRFEEPVVESGPAGRLELEDGVSGYWERAVSASMTYAADVFANKRHPLALGPEEYLTVLDVSTASLFILDRLCEMALERRVLLVGVAKDTTATDVARSVLPFASSRGFVKLNSPQPRLKSDRAFLAILSSENPSIRTPWRTMGYDSAFSTIVAGRDGFVSARKFVSRERAFVRSYFQLRSLKSDATVRSQVFLFDRPFDPSRDEALVRSFTVREKAGPSEIRAYFEGDDGSEPSNLALHVLSLSDNPEVFEAFGHNQLLYLADKAVKAEVGMLRSSLRGVADLRVGGVSSRRKIFGLATTYREQRAEAEHARKSGGGFR